MNHLNPNNRDILQHWVLQAKTGKSHTVAKKLVKPTMETNSMYFTCPQNKTSFGKHPLAKNATGYWLKQCFYNVEELSLSFEKLVKWPVLYPKCIQHM